MPQPPDMTASPTSDPVVDLAADAATVPDAAGSAVIARARRGAAAVDAVVEDARASIPGWDNLAWVDAFARAAERAREVLLTSTHPIERRVIGRRLLRLMPQALLPEAMRERTVTLNLPDSVLSRADNDFALTDDDVPRVHPSWTAHLTRPGLTDDVLAPGRHEWLLAPRSFSPKDAVGSAMLVRVVGQGTGQSGDLLQLEIKNPGGHTSRRRRTSDGRDAGPAEIKKDVLLAWLRHGGPGGRGLDLRRPDDRCLLLTFQETLRERRLDGLLARQASDDHERRAAVVAAVIDTAIDAIAFSALDPLACRFVFPADAAWAGPAVERLKALGLGMEVMPLRATTPTRDIVWLDGIVDAGFVGGAMSDVAQARAFARLAVSVLSPLGVLPLVGARCGRGVVLTLLDDDHRGARQRGPLWVEPASGSEGEAALMPVWEAWARGHGRLLPAPSTDTAHDVAALPAFLQAFADAIADRANPGAADGMSDDGEVAVDPGSAPPAPATTTSAPTGVAPDASDEPELVDDDDVDPLEDSLPPRRALDMDIDADLDTEQP